ncbi:MAG: flagellar hook-associated protein FlgK [Brevinematales bacterium]|nr:flagellar hook-associated protein FlgK [Brevinematales bacterium]
MAILSSFHGIEVGRKSLLAHSDALKTTGHNISNLNNPEYSRQIIHLKAFHPIYDPSWNRETTPGQLGTGVAVEDIVRARDQFLDDRIMFENGGLGFWEARRKFLYQLQLIYNEPEGPNIRTTLDEYWDALQKVAMDPTEVSSRVVLVEKAKSLASQIRHEYNSIIKLREQANDLIKQKINEINGYAKEIATLNNQIQKLEALGDNPNDLYDRRDALVEKLSKIMNIKVGRSDKNEFMIMVGSEILIQGENYHELIGIPNAQNKGFVDIYIGSPDRRLKISDGELFGLVFARDIDLVSDMKRLNAFTINLIESVNEIHKDGFGLDGTTGLDFWIKAPITPDIRGNYDSNEDGIFDKTAIFKITGTNKLNPDDFINSAGVINFGPNTSGGPNITVEYNENDTVKSIIEKINNSGAHVVAYLNHRGELTIKARMSEDTEYPDFVIRYISDSGNFLVGFAGILHQSGELGAYDWNNIEQIAQIRGDINYYSVAPLDEPALWIDVNPLIYKDPRLVGAASGKDLNGDRILDTTNGPGDNSNILLIASLRDKKVMLERDSTFLEYLKFVVGDIGTRSKISEVATKKQSLVIENLQKLREAVSGVNLDEELTKLISYQRAYEASARYITYLDSMLDTIINRMGIVR